MDAELQLGAADTGVTRIPVPVKAQARFQAAHDHISSQCSSALASHIAQRRRQKSIVDVANEKKALLAAKSASAPSSRPKPVRFAAMRRAV